MINTKDVVRGTLTVEGMAAEIKSIASRYTDEQIADLLRLFYLTSKLETALVNEWTAKVLAQKEAAT